MQAKRLNTDINGTATATFIAAAFSTIAIATAFGAAFRLGRGVNSTLNDGRSRLGLNLGHFGRSVLCRHPLRNWQGGKGGYLHRILLKQPFILIPPILANYNQNIVNHFMFKSILDKLLIFNRLALIGGSNKGLSLCLQMRAL